MDLANTVDSFADNFLRTDSNVDQEMIDYRDHGWVCDIKNFNTIFEKMAKVSNDLYQNGQVEIESLDEKLAKLTNEFEARTLSANVLEKELDEMQNMCERLKSDIQKQDEIKSDLQKQAENNYLDLEKEVSLIGKLNKTLSLITRLNWDDKAMKKDSNLIKGFVFKKSNNDVSVFEIDSKKTSNKTVVSDLLWAYIG